MEEAIKGRLKELGLRVDWNESKPYATDEPTYAVDFNIVDSGDNVAWVWGYGWDDLEWECEHPTGITEFTDDDEYGVCPICGSRCEWNWREEWEDEGHDEDGNCVGRQIKTREITEWYPRRSPGGIIGMIIEERGGKEKKKW